MIERMYYYGEDTEGNAEGLCGQPEIQQHCRDYGRDEGDVPGRLVACDGERAGYRAGVRKKPVDVGSWCQKQATELPQQVLKKEENWDILSTFFAYPADSPTTIPCARCSTCRAGKLSGTGPPDVEIGTWFCPSSSSCSRTACPRLPLSVSRRGDGIHATRTYRLPAWNTGGYAELRRVVSSPGNLLICSRSLDYSLSPFTL